MRWFSLALAVLALLPTPSQAACAAPIYTQFDFWVGNWRVTDARGRLLGHDFVSKRYGGCVVFEEYHDANDPGVGIGITGYDAGRKRWHQTFMDDAGFVLDLYGRFRNGSMVLEGSDYPSGRPRLNRGYWTKRGDVVEELWTVSTDGGRTWTTHFDGWFRRAP